MSTISTPPMATTNARQLVRLDPSKASVARSKSSADNKFTTSSTDTIEKVARYLGRPSQDLPMVLKDPLADIGSQNADYGSIYAGFSILEEADGYGNVFGFYPLDDLTDCRQACLLLAAIDDESAQILSSRDAIARRDGWAPAFTRMNAGDTALRNKLCLASASLFGVCLLTSLFASQSSTVAPDIVVNMSVISFTMASSTAISLLLTRPKQSPFERDRSFVEIDAAHRLSERLRALKTIT